MELLFLKPLFKEAIWGGKALSERFGYDIASDATGECWAVSAHKNGECRIAGGTYDGVLLGDLWKEKPELFGPCPGEVFPLLVKIIDARQDLSIQVHPDDIYAGIHENGSLGKTECWYILDCEPETEIVIGHYAKDRAEMETMIREGRWKEFLRTVPVKKRDFFQIEPGCVHAIKGGTLILETQQSSDVTYRVYDYGRLSGGKPRELHVEKSLATIKAPFEEARITPSSEVLPGAIHTHFVTCPYYQVDKYEVEGVFCKDFGKYFTNISIIEGKGRIEEVPVTAGQHLILPANSGPCRMEGQMTLICSNPQ